MTPTLEQEHILDLATSTRDNLQIVAYAGAGKSSTLRMVAKTVKTKPQLYLVFNKRNADEIAFDPKANVEDAKKRMPYYVTVRTLNSLGHRIWAHTQPNGRLSLNERKSNDILKAIISEAPKGTQQVLWDCYWPVAEAVSLAKAIGYIPQGHAKSEKSLCTIEALASQLDEKPDDLTTDLIDEVLTRSIAAAYEGNIDYNDQVYMPALFGGAFPQFPLVAVDEAQDLNPVNHAMLSRLVKQRFMAVGDPYQSIYGFRGAMQSGMGKLRDTFSMTEADLSISFRCPEAIVKHAQWRVPKFRWMKEGGHVEELKTLLLGNIADTDVIICRNNAPLFKLAIHLLMAKRSVSVAGSDIGPKILNIMKRLGSDEMSQSQTLNKIEEWRREKLGKLSKSADDVADCMKVFASYGNTLSQAVAYAENLFSQRGAIRLTTGHKAKGLEFPVVYHLDPWLCGDDEQDQNLRYVITTRSADRLYEVNSKDIH